LVRVGRRPTCGCRMLTLRETPARGRGRSMGCSDMLPIEGMICTLDVGAQLQGETRSRLRCSTSLGSSMLRVSVADALRGRAGAGVSHTPLRFRPLRPACAVRRSAMLLGARSDTLQCARSSGKSRLVARKIERPRRGCAAKLLHQPSRFAKPLRLGEVAAACIESRPPCHPCFLGSGVRRPSPLLPRRRSALRPRSVCAAAAQKANLGPIINTPVFKQLLEYILRNQTQRVPRFA